MRAPILDVHPSNLLTYTSLAAALGAIAAAGGRGGAALAGALLAIAALADTFDGRFARSFARTERQRRVGRQLDSLVDMVGFGIAPVVVFGKLAPPQGAMVAWVWWISACAYVLATATRLSFYNAEEDDAGFVGVPTPVAALIWATYLLVATLPWIVAALFIVVGAAMVSPLAIPRPRRLALAAFALWPAALIVLHATRVLHR
jgi:CDP-diacylglycerol--serine O-phosphatidyltransferase